MEGPANQGGDDSTKSGDISAANQGGDDSTKSGDISAAIATFNKYHVDVPAGYAFLSPLGVFVETEQLRTNNSPVSNAMIAGWYALSATDKAPFVVLAEQRMRLHEKSVIHHLAKIIREKKYNDEESDGEGTESFDLKASSPLKVFLTEFMEKSVKEGLFDVTNKSAEVLLGEQLDIWEKMTADEKILFEDKAAVIMDMYDDELKVAPQLLAHWVR